MTGTTQGTWRAICSSAATVGPRSGRSSIGRPGSSSLVHLRRRRTAAEIRQALESLPFLLRRSLTWDQGKELAAHRHITATTGTPVFFSHAHSP